MCLTHNLLKLFRSSASGVLLIFHADEHIVESLQDVFGAGIRKAAECIDERRGISVLSIGREFGLDRGPSLPGSFMSESGFV